MRVIKVNTSIHSVFFASDAHLDHLRDFVYGPRGFKTPEEHSVAIIKGINEHVGVDDVLIYLGDFSLNSSVERTKAYFRQIKCQNIYFIWGNHESNTSKIYKEALEREFGGPVPFEAYPIKWENVTFLGREAFFAIDKQTIFVSHFAHLIWEEMQHGVWHLCGHSHSNCTQINPECKEGKVLDVGVDNALRLTKSPVFSYEQVAEIMKRKEIVVVDHHNRNTT